MTAHIIFNKIDNQNTVTQSKKLIKLIRQKIGFKNILISDDLSMKSLKGSLEKIQLKRLKQVVISFYIATETLMKWK